MPMYPTMIIIIWLYVIAHTVTYVEGVCRIGVQYSRSIATIEATEAAASVNEDNELEMKQQKMEIP